jgi:hypothetical protein
VTFYENRGNSDNNPLEFLSLVLHLDVDVSASKLRLQTHSDSAEGG